jgi:hypothetical protein
MPAHEHLSLKRFGAADHLGEVLERISKHMHAWWKPKTLARWIPLRL